MNWYGLSRDPKWAALAKQVAEAEGFNAARFPAVGQAFCHGGEVLRCVQVFFQRVTFENVAPTVWLGASVEAFELGWCDRLSRTGLPSEGESPPFCLNAVNVDRLSPRPWTPNSPSDEEVAELQDYLGRSFDYARRRLPSTVDDLVAAIEADRIGDDAVWAYLGHPVKVRGFVQWLRREHGVDVRERVLPLLDDRTEPYDVEVMLGEP